MFLDKVKIHVDGLIGGHVNLGIVLERFLLCSNISIVLAYGVGCRGLHISQLVTSPKLLKTSSQNSTIWGDAFLMITVMRY